MVHTRTSNSFVVEIDLKIERTYLRNLRQSLQDLVTESMAEQSLRDLMHPDLTQQPLAVAVPPLANRVDFELRPEFISLLPKFHGRSSEDPIMHLSEFHDICMCSKPGDVTDEKIKMRAFGFTLKEVARSWYYHLPTGKIDTWSKLHRAFLEKYFPSTKAVALQRTIANIEQADEESLYDYCERFNKLCASCPYHGFDER